MTIISSLRFLYIFWWIWPTVRPPPQIFRPCDMPGHDEVDMYLIILEMSPDFALFLHSCQPGVVWWFKRDQNLVNVVKQCPTRAKEEHSRVHNSKCVNTLLLFFFLHTRLSFNIQAKHITSGHNIVGLKLR